MDYIDDLPSKSTLNQKVKAEDINRFERETHRYTALKNETNYIKKCAILIGLSAKPQQVKKNNMSYFLKKVLTEDRVI